MPQDKILLAKAKAQIFQEQLETHVKRLNPVQLAETFAHKVEQVLANRDLMSQWPLHYMLHAIEASCAYHRKTYSETPTAQHLRKIMNVYHTYYDPLSHYLLTESNRIDIFLATYARQQFYLQEEVNRYDAARAILLFDEDSYPVTSALMIERFGFGFRDWITFCFSVHAGLLRTSPGVIRSTYFDSTRGELIDLNKVPKLFAALSSTVDQVGEHYKATRQRYGYLYDPYYTSSFAKKPLISLHTGHYLAPHKPLVLQHGVEGLFDLSKDSWPKQFGAEFGSAFERYIGQVLSEMPDVQVFTENGMRVVTNEKICDYIVVGEQFILLLECKAVEYSAATSSERAVRGDNSTTKIAKAVDQLMSAANLITTGTLSGVLGDTGTRSTLGAIVTFRHIYMANTDEFWKENIAPQSKSAAEGQWHEKFDYRPQVMDVSALEQLVLLAKHRDTTPLELFAEKLSQSEYQAGEWSTYLCQRTEGLSLTTLQNRFEEFTGRMLQSLHHSAPS